MYNEEKVASRCINAVIKELKKVKSKSILIAVNDGSHDKTKEILDILQKKEKKYLHVVHHTKNKGYGGAIQTGIETSLKNGYEFCLTMDSDLTNDPKHIHKFTKMMNSGYDCIKASRYVKGGKTVGVPLYRRVISQTGNFVASLLFNVGIKDCTNGFRMVRLSKLKGIKFRERNFSIILEEMYYLKKRGSRFTEIPYTLTARTDTVSHFSYKPRIFYDYFKYVLSAAFIH